MEGRIASVECAVEHREGIVVASRGDGCDTSRGKQYRVHVGEAVRHDHALGGGRKLLGPRGVAADRGGCREPARDACAPDALSGVLGQPVAFDRRHLGDLPFADQCCVPLHHRQNLRQETEAAVIAQHRCELGKDLERERMVADRVRRHRDEPTREGIAGGSRDRLGSARHDLRPALARRHAGDDGHQTRLERR